VRPAETTGAAPRLVLRFAGYTALTIGAAAAALFWFVHRDSVDQAEENARSQTQLIVGSLLPEHLRPADFARAVGPARREQLDRFFRSSLLNQDFLRVKLYSPTGLVTYSSDHSLIGSRPDPEETVGILQRGSKVDVSTLDREGGNARNVKVMETYEPVLLHGRQVGVFETYQDYGPIAAAARSSFLPIASALGLTLIALYVVLIPILRRVTKRLERQLEEIEHQAVHDGLTGLPNRLLFNDRVEQALREARRDHNGFAVLLIDLDRFKEINDTLGHQSGDRVLQEVSARLSGVVRESDTIARLGGDEFALLARAAMEPAAAFAVARRVHDALAVPLRLDGLLLDVAASVGITLYPTHGDDAETLMRRADVAMYLCKELHTDTELYTVERDTYSAGRLQLIGELRHAIEASELVVHYQPQAELPLGRIVSVEALVRWQHPTRGLLPPSEFVPLAEHTGLVRPLTMYVLDTALCQSRAWRQAGIDLRVAVNITARDLLDVRFVDEVRELLERWQVPPERLELELTENTILTDPARARTVLARLSELGVRVAIDDFGSGNSSLGYLKRLPVDVLKIDRTFVVNMAADPDDAVIVRSTVELGHNLGLEVVAEGVENETTLRRLAELDCDTVQGYHLGHPEPAERVAERLLVPPVEARTA
jgi:diguanylate cyclase (GGDEF)-like protein